MSRFSRDLDRALALAALVHRAQTRKGTRVPYVMHPVHVSMLLMQYGYGEPLTVAAVLHDVLEDMDFADASLAADIVASFPGLTPDAPANQGGFRSVLARLFGHDVLRLVDAVSERKNDGEPERPWIERRAELLDRLDGATSDVAILKAADALHNVCSIIEDVTLGRASLAGRFKATPDQTLWYYREVAKRVRERVDRTPLVVDLEGAVARLAALIPL